MFAVETHQLTRRFGDFVAVNQVNLAIKPGTIYGFLGPNGSGKSTTIRMLCGILRPTSGTGRILDMDLAGDSEAIKTKIGYMSQKFSLYDDLTVVENLEFYAGLYGLEASVKQSRIEAMLAMAGLLGRRRELTAHLSGGWKQRLALGCAIVHTPPILFLDEPTGGVDPQSRRLFWDIIYALAAEGMTVMVTTHFMDEAEHCDEIGFILDGKLIANDTPNNLKQAIAETLLEIKTQDPLGLLQDITDRQIPAADMYPYGASVHILTLPEQIQRFSGYAYQVITPSLEDVFVAAVKKQREQR